MDDEARGRAFETIVDDLQAEHGALREVLGALPFDDWERATHAEGWAVRDQVAHLAFFDETATTAIADPGRFAADARTMAERRRTDGEPRYLVEARARSAAEILEWWERASGRLVEASRTLDSTRRMPWYGPPMAATSFVTARLLEDFWKVHGCGPG